MQTDLAISVRRALPGTEDAADVAALVNSAYAVESFFVEGDRTTGAEIEELMQSGTFVVLEHSLGLAAAVFIKPLGDGTSYLGMLSVDPAFQGHGLGTRLVRIVEALSEAAGYSAVTLRIINLREELGRWYRSLGFVECGTSPYEHRPVKQACHFIEMRKPLGAGRAGHTSLAAAAA